MFPGLLMVSNMFEQCIYQRSLQLVIMLDENLGQKEAIKKQASSILCPDFEKNI